MRVDVIIPAYKPGKQFLKLLDRLESQTVRPDRMIIINTEKIWLEALISEAELHKRYRNVLVRHITEREFDHGGSRNLGVAESQADCFIMMTQDAVPTDNSMIESLLNALKDERTAVAYARQCPDRDSDALERFIRHYNYGADPLYKTRKDVAQMGIKAYFCSNVCAIYQRDLFQLLGGFIEKTVFNEDMIYAARAIKAGYAIQYVPAARVFHSHRYTNHQQFCRNFDIGVSHADHPEVFGGLSSEAEGIRMIRLASIYLVKSKQPHLIGRLFIQSLSKYVGYYLGRRYKKLPRNKAVKYSMNHNYWI